MPRIVDNAAERIGEDGESLIEADPVLLAIGGVFARTYRDTRASA